MKQKNREVFVMGMLGIFPEEDKIMVGVADLMPLLNQFNGKYVQIEVSEFSVNSLTTKDEDNNEM